MRCAAPARWVGWGLPGRRVFRPKKNPATAGPSGRVFGRHVSLEREEAQAAQARTLPRLSKAAGVLGYREADFARSVTLSTQRKERRPGAGRGSAASVWFAVADHRTRPSLRRFCGSCRTAAAATTTASMRCSIVMRLRATDGRIVSECQAKRPDQALESHSDGLVPVAIHPPIRASGQSRKSVPFKPARESSGESRA